ncbi:XdhC family protein [Embleya sp. NBC_00888]|uniref:XdhC family protein n=1 Tax=Embleya sp. NBC_00888 TaxID=2975960 RepID=UPI0038667D14
MDTTDGHETVFVRGHLPRPRLLVFGSNDYATAVAAVGSFTGYRVTVCDARAVFATPDRFPHVDELVVDWPDRYLARTRTDRRTAVCVLTHDPKFDVPVLARALRLPVAYIGAMGSRQAHRDRLDRLRRAGLTPAELTRLHSPIGLDLGARTPQQTAVAILAEIISATQGGTGRSPVPHHRSNPPRRSLGELTSRGHCRFADLQGALPFMGALPAEYSAPAVLDHVAALGVSARIGPGRRLRRHHRTACHRRGRRAVDPGTSPCGHEPAVRPTMPMPRVRPAMRGRRSNWRGCRRAWRSRSRDRSGMEKPRPPRSA